MEPIEWILILTLIFGGHEIHQQHEREKDGVVVIEKPDYKKGKYFRSEEGYYVTNLQPTPISDTNELDSVSDCGKSIQSNTAASESSTSVKTPLLNAGCAEQ